MNNSPSDWSHACRDHNGSMDLHSESCTDTAQETAECFQRSLKLEPERGGGEGNGQMGASIATSLDPPLQGTLEELRLTMLWLRKVATIAVRPTEHPPN